MTTVIFANRAYAILYGEYAAVGAAEPGRNARRMFDLADPAPGWVKLAEGFGVPATRVATAESFSRVFADAMAGRGPRLIEAVIA